MANLTLQIYSTWREITVAVLFTVVLCQALWSISKWTVQIWNLHKNTYESWGRRLASHLNDLITCATLFRTYHRGLVCPPHIPYVLWFLPYNTLFPILVFTFHRSLGDLCTLISLHIFQLLLIAYSDAAMNSTLTHAQSAYLCTAHTARLPMCSLLVQ